MLLQSRTNDRFSMGLPKCFHFNSYFLLLAVICLFSKKKPQQMGNEDANHFGTQERLCSCWPPVTFPNQQWGLHRTGDFFKALSFMV